MVYTNVQRVRILYKTIMKLHRGLPAELKDLGSNYARDEFKRHKKCNAKEAEIFVKEWTNYALSLAKQLGLKTAHPHRGTKQFGAELDDLGQFKDDQIYQLYELMEATRVSNNVLPKS